VNQVAVLGPLVAPGFFANAAVTFALLVGAVVAVVSGVVGTVTVMRGQSFAGHSLADIGSAGGSAAFLIGVSPLFGFVVLNLAAAGVMDLMGIRRPRGRDVATGIVLGAALGLAALFLYLDTTTSSTTGVAMNVLFGSIFTVSPSLTPVILLCGAMAVGVVLLFYRALVLSSISSDLAAARGVRVRAVGVGFLLAMAIAVSLSALTIGAILSTALLVGPAAIALRLTRQTGVAMLLAAGIGVAVTWLGVLLAYDSYSWPPAQSGWPVSFFVVALIFVAFVLAQVMPRRGGQRRSNS
jgi:zinc/manganese transport system permease protein